MLSSPVKVYDPFASQNDVLMSVGDIESYIHHRVQKTLNGVVKFRLFANVRVKDLFCPKSRCVVVLRRRDGSYIRLA